MYKVEIFTDQFVFASVAMIDKATTVIEQDFLAYDNYTIQTPAIECEKGYLVHITDENNVFVADGIVGDVKPKDEMQDISIRPLNALFDAEVFYTPVSDCISWLATNIDAAFMHNTDTVQNRPIALTYTQSGSDLPLTGFNLHETVNILSVIISALKTYGVVVESKLDLVNSKFSVNIYQQSATKTLEASLENVLQKAVTIGDSYGSLNKAIIRKVQTVDDTTTILGQTEFYLHSDGTISSTNSDRIVPVFYDLESLEKDTDMTDAQWDAAALARAKEILQPAKYDNEIDLQYDTDDLLARPMEQKIGTLTTIFLDGDIYVSILTGRRIEGQKITLMYGVTRTELTKQLNMKQRETVSYENTVSAIMSQVQKEYGGKVNRTGDTMTGDLIMKSSNIDSSVTPGSAVYSNVRLRYHDKNSKSLANVHAFRTAANYSGIGFTGSNPNTNVTNGLELRVKDDGTRQIGVSAPAPWRNVIGPPVGDVIITSTNTNPSTNYGGTWELIDKVFTENDTNTTTLVTRNTTNVSSIESARLWRRGHEITLRVRLVTAKALNDSTLDLFTVPYSTIGVNSWYNDQDIVGITGGGNGIVLAQINGDGVSTALLRSTDVITKTSGGTIPSGSAIDFTIRIICRPATMLDSACNQFYWKRTA